MTGSQEKQSNRTRLRVLMAAHDLAAADIGLMLNRKPETVQSWMANGRIDIPDNLITLLEMKFTNK